MSTEAKPVVTVEACDHRMDRTNKMIAVMVVLLLGYLGVAWYSLDRSWAAEGAAHQALATIEANTRADAEWKTFMRESVTELKAELKGSLGEVKTELRDLRTTSGKTP